MAIERKGIWQQYKEELKKHSGRHPYEVRAEILANQFAKAVVIEDMRFGRLAIAVGLIGGSAGALGLRFLGSRNAERLDAGRMASRAILVGGILSTVFGIGIEFLGRKTLQLIDEVRAEVCPYKAEGTMI